MTAEKITLEIDLDDAEVFIEGHGCRCSACSIVVAYFQLEIAKIHRRLEREQEPA